MAPAAFDAVIGDVAAGRYSDLHLAAFVAGCAGDHLDLDRTGQRDGLAMGMPAAVYRLYIRAHGVKSLERNILGFNGIAPVHETLVGMAGKFEPKDAEGWLAKVRRVGQKGQ